MEYFDKLKERLEPKLQGKELTKDSNFKELGIDSLDLVDLVFELEEEIGVEFEDEELLKLNTVQDLLNLIDSKKQRGDLYFFMKEGYYDISN